MRKWGGNIVRRAPCLAMRVCTDFSYESRLEKTGIRAGLRKGYNLQGPPLMAYLRQQALPSKYSTAFITEATRDCIFKAGAQEGLFIFKSQQQLIYFFTPINTLLKWKSTPLLPVVV